MMVYQTRQLVEMVATKGAMEEKRRALIANHARHVAEKYVEVCPISHRHTRLRPTCAVVPTVHR